MGFQVRSAQRETGCRILPEQQCRSFQHRHRLLGQMQRQISGAQLVESIPSWGATAIRFTSMSSTSSYFFPVCNAHAIFR